MNRHALAATLDAAGSALPPLARRLFDARTAGLRPATPSVPAGGNRGPLMSDGASPGERPLTAREERHLLGLTQAGRRLLAERDRESPPPVDSEIAALLELTPLGRAALAYHAGAARPSPGRAV